MWIQPRLTTILNFKTKFKGLNIILSRKFSHSTTISFYISGYKMPNPSKIYRLSIMCFDKRASLKCAFIVNPYIRIIFYQSFLFFLSFHPHFYIFKNFNHFSTICQGFSIFESILKAFDQFISFHVYVFFFSLTIYTSLIEKF